MSLPYFLSLATLVLAFATPLQASWNVWYTITLPGGVRYGYYNEKMERRDGKLFYQVQSSKREEGFLNEDQLGAFSTENLTPLFYNFHSTYRAQETFIDGTVGEKRLLTVKVRRGDAPPQLFKKSLPPDCFFEAFFPYWLKSKASELNRPGASLPFKTILEDNIDESFAIVHGRVRMEKPDTDPDLAKLKKLTVEYRGVKTVWWIDDNGLAARIERPGQGILVERVSEEKAKKFLQ